MSIMIIEQLVNYAPWYYKGMRNPGDTRIILGQVSDTQKLELEQLVDAIFVRNELLSGNLHLSHEPDNFVKCLIRKFIPGGHYFFCEPGLKKTKQDDAAGGYTITYESGRSGNPYEAIRSSSDYYGATMRIGPVKGYKILSGDVHIFVHLHRQDYGDILIGEICRKYNLQDFRGGDRNILF